MGIVTAQHSMSIDGFIADEEGRGDRLHAWLTAGSTRSRLNPNFSMDPVNARFFDEGVGRCGAVISGRRTYDVSSGWGGAGPMGSLPLFVLTHKPPTVIPSADPPYTFVTDGIDAAVAAARRAAAGKNVVLMGASVVQQTLRAGLLDELVISIVPMMLGTGVRLLEGGVPDETTFDITQVIDGAGVTHLTYRVSSYRRQMSTDASHPVISTSADPVPTERQPTVPSAARTV